MKSRFLGLAAKAAWVAALAGLSLNAATLEDFAGKWTTKRVNDDGQSVTMTMEFEGPKMHFRILDSSGEARFYAKAKTKLEKFGPFEALRFYDIQAGGSPDDTQPIDDERVSLVRLDGETFHLAGNFDRRRDNETPSVDAYKRTAKPAAESADAKFKGRWRVELTTGNDTSEGVLVLSPQGGGWSGSYINDQGEERNFKKVAVEQNELVLEMDGNIDGNPVTFLSKAKLTGGKMTGTVMLKEQPNEVIGNWTAQK